MGVEQKVLRDEFDDMKLRVGAHPRMFTVRGCTESAYMQELFVMSMRHRMLFRTPVSTPLMSQHPGTCVHTHCCGSTPGRGMRQDMT